MLSLEFIFGLLSELESKEWSVLYALERLIFSFEAIPLTKISSASGLDEEETGYFLNRLDEKKLILKNGQGYSLLSSGLDALVLNAFVKRKMIECVGKKIKTRKESEIIEVTNNDGEEFCIKLFRKENNNSGLDKTKQICSPSYTSHHNLFKNVQAAKREFEALTKLNSFNVSVPKAIARERHAIFMNKINGFFLPDMKKLDSPRDLLSKILFNIRQAYTLGGIVNTGFNEYKIIVDGEKAWLIDWSQYVNKFDLNASLLLDRDIFNIIKFFKRFQVDCKLELASFFVRGWSEKLEIL